MTSALTAIISLSDWHIGSVQCFLCCSFVLLFHAHVLVTTQSFSPALTCTWYLQLPIQVFWQHAANIHLKLICSVDNLFMQQSLAERREGGCLGAGLLKMWSGRTPSAHLHHLMSYHSHFSLLLLLSPPLPPKLKLPARFHLFIHFTISPFQMQMLHYYCVAII